MANKQKSQLMFTRVVGQRKRILPSSSFKPSSSPTGSITKAKKYKNGFKVVIDRIESK